MAEMLQGCDRNGRPTAAVSREACHGNPSQVHLTVHLHVFDHQGRLLLQERSARKDLYPNRWDTAVGGHVEAGESPWQALAREAREELGLDAAGAVPLHEYLHCNEHESEYVHAFALRHPGPFAANPEEISQVRFFTVAEIAALLGTGALTPNFEEEFRRLDTSEYWGR